MKRVALLSVILALCAFGAAFAVDLPAGEAKFNLWLNDEAVHEYIGTGDPAATVCWNDEANTAAFSVGKAELVLRNLTIENRAIGGGIAVWGSKDSKITLENCIIRGGRDGVWSEGGQLILTNCVIADNYKTGVGSNASWSAINCIFFGNGVAAVRQSGNVSVWYSCFFQNGDNLGIINELKNIYADPLFVNTDATEGKRYDFHLQSDSPCIDASDPSLTDPNGSTRDIGVYGGIEGSLTRPPTMYDVVINVNPPAALDSVVVNEVVRAEPCTISVAENSIISVSADNIRAVNGWKYVSQKAYPVSFTASADTTVTLTYDTFVWVEVKSQFGAPAGTGWYKPNDIVSASVPDTMEVKGKKYAFNYWLRGSDKMKVATSSSRFLVSKPETYEAYWHKVLPVQVALSVSKPLVGSVEVVPKKDTYTEGDTVAVTYHAPAPLDGQKVVWKGWHGDITTMDTSVVVIAGQKNMSLVPVVEVKYRLRWSTDPASDWVGEKWYERGKTVKLAPPDSVVIGRSVYFFSDTLKVNNGQPFKAYNRQYVASIYSPRDIVFLYKFAYDLGLLGDFNRDGVVDEKDFDRFVRAYLIQQMPGWWESYCKPCDLDGDGMLTLNDARLFLAQVDDSAARANVIVMMNLLSGLTGVEEEGNSTPSKFALYPNYPNPFNPVTTIAFDLPKVSEVRLAIYTVSGQQVTTLVSGHQEAGHYEVRWDANVASGVYICRLQAGEFTATRRMILVR